MKKIRFNSEIALLIALAVLALGVVFVIKADFGMTVVQAPVYVLSLSVPQLSIGIWNYIVQGSLFILMIIIVRQFKISYIISFLSAIIYGLMLDFFTYLMSSLVAETVFMAIIFYLIGFVLLSIAVSLFFTCNAPLMPYDIFIREVAFKKNVSIPKFKWGFDIACLTVALIISLSIKRSIVGLGIGTVIFAFLISPVMAQLIRLINRFIIFTPFIKDRTITLKKFLDE